MNPVKRRLKQLVRRKIKQPAKRAVRQKITRPARKRIGRLTSRECSTCHKRYSNPFTHTCVVKTDYKRRVRKARRDAKTAARRAARKAAAERRKAARKAAAARRKAKAAERKAARLAAREAAKRRQPTTEHRYWMCDDLECHRMACKAYREGRERGVEECPLVHM